MQHVILALAVLMPAVAATEESGWPYYGGDAGGTKYSDVSHITPDNVGRLEIAWTFRTGETGEGYASAGSLTFEATPVLWNGALYFTTGFNKAFAVDAVTGRGRWRFDAAIPRDYDYAEVASRGVALWHDGDASAGAVCAHRVFFGTLTGRVHALDALTGRPCTDFGERGSVDMTLGVRPTEPGEYTITSPPAILDDAIVVGSAIGDNGAVELARGIVRALDARTGAVRWAWDPIPKDADDPASASWQPGSAERTGAGNAWAPLSVDAQNGMVFVPTSAPSPDFYGGERKGDNRYANSLVALNGANGKVAWHFQLVHHDVWDYDVASQPVLFDLERGGRRIPAVAQATKMGMIFVFHRLTGEPLFPIEERSVPQDGVAGEALSPTQPFSSLPPLVDHGPVTAGDAFGVTFFDQRGCRRAIEGYRSEGIYTPPSLEGTIVYPGYAGGSNWGGIALDPRRRLVVANVMQLPMIVKLFGRDEGERRRAAAELDDWGGGGMRGTPYVMARRMFASALDLPCTRPPWGKLVALDLDDGRIVWERHLGTIEDLAPGPVPNFEWGVPNIGGPIVTASGLIFIAAAADNYLRAFDLKSGAELWKGRLPRGGQATPMTYAIEGRQFVVIAAGGHGNAGIETGDFLVSFALPRG